MKKVYIDCTFNPYLKTGVEEFSINMLDAISNWNTESLEVSIIVKAEFKSYFEGKYGSKFFIKEFSTNKSWKHLKEFIKKNTFLMKLLRKIPVYNFMAVPQIKFQSPNKPDLLIFFGQFAYLPNVPYFYFPHDIQHEFYPHHFSKHELSKKNKFYRTLSENASRVFVFSQSEKNKIAKKYNLNKEAVKVIPQGAPQAKDIREAKSKGIDVKDFYFYPAVPWNHKNHYNLLKAIKYIKEVYNKEINLVTCGDKNKGDINLDVLTQNFNLSKNVKNLGYISSSDKESLMDETKALVFPSLYEGWGIPIIEAAQKGKPILANKLDVFQEIWGDSLIYFDGTNPCSIAKTIFHFEKGSYFWGTLPRLANNISSEFSWEKSATLLMREAIKEA
ncbi:glycosyltransferase family 4 protein [Thiohalorhabdus sp. Cl-TMA]|uniref:Glycosyltransferase family 4 protein n=1 Tax=Thiohalorhabdus methylotrophus TaxID=3242694 RepID=A0ABV4U2U3_9GAMM